MTAVARAVLLCAARRVGWRPLGLAIALPALAFVAGRRAGPSLADAVSSSRPLALGLALGLGGAAVVAGSIAALVLTRWRFLGSQLAAAPISPAALFVAVTLVPLLAGAVVASAVESAFLVPAVGGRTPVVLAAGLAGFALGAAAAEALAGVRSSPRMAGILAGVAGLWAAGTVGAGTGAVVGPFGYLGLALRGEPAAAGRHGPALAAIAVAALGLWVAAGAARREDRASRSPARVLVPVGGRQLPAAFATALKRYGRWPELRRAGWAAAVLAGGGGLLLVAHVGAVAVSLVGPLAVLGAAIFPLASAGIDREAEWLWRSAPVRRSRLAAAATLAAVALGLAHVLVGVGPAAAWARAPGSTLLQVAGAAVFVLAAAAIAGALVPWRSERPAEELATCAAFLGVAGGLWLTLGRAVDVLGGGTLVNVAMLAAVALAAPALAGAVAERVGGW
jgi:hypothetical protein